MPSAAATRLRPYQTDALDALTGAIEDGSRDLLLESPVGSGKTTMVKALAALLLAGAHRLIVVLVPQNLLKEQWARAGSWVVGDAPVTLPSGRTIETTRELTPGDVDADALLADAFPGLQRHAHAREALTTWTPA